MVYYVNMYLSMKRFTFILLLTFTQIIRSVAANQASITIDDREKYQHISGFGGFGPSPSWSYNWMSNSEIDMLYGDGENQLGYNIMRLYIANSSTGWNQAVNMAKRAKSHGAFLFASPWSPPASWKDNNDSNNGGKLLPEYYDDWADFLNRFVLYMKNTGGVEIDAISIQNEPDYKTSYQSCVWTGEEFATFLKKYGSKISAKIIAPEGVHFTHSLSDPILNDPEACAELDILGGHFYGWNGSPYPLAIEKGKEVWMTEFLINERQENNGYNIDWKNDAFLFARSINDAMLANMSAWVHYSLKRYYGCIGDGNFGTVNGQITKRGYILSHYAKYVTGTTRIKHSLNESSGKMTSSAYLSVTGDSIVVMVINPTSSSYSMDFNLPFYTKGGMSVITTESVNMKKNALAYSEETYIPNIAVDAYSVNTYIFVKSADREVDSEEETVTVVYSDKFENNGGKACIPNGWKIVYEGGTRTAGEYSLGPRLFYFSPEGQFTTGLYFRGDNNTRGTATYGSLSGYKLNLQPGKYKLSYSAIGWKATGSITAAIIKPNGTSLVSKQLSVKSHLNGKSGSSVRITSASESEINFEISEAGNYQLRWILPLSSGGLYEMIIGDISIVKIEDTTSVQPTDYLTGDDIVSVRYYNLNGTEIEMPQNGLYIVKTTYSNGKTQVRKEIK